MNHLLEKSQRLVYNYLHRKEPNQSQTTTFEERSNDFIFVGGNKNGGHAMACHTMVLITTVSTYLPTLCVCYTVLAKEFIILH